MADAVYASAHQMMAQRTNEQIAAIQQQKAAYVEDQKKKLEDLSAQTQQKEDPDAYWKERGTFGSVLTGIMIGLGQFASMASGRGTNGALQIVNEGIDRNIASQRANIANAHKAYDTASNLFEKNLAAFGDEERAALATKVQYLDQVAAMADAQRAQAGITDAEAANHGFLRGIYNQRAQAADDFAKLTHTQIAEQETEHYAPATTIGGPTADAPREKNLVTLSDGTTVKMPEGTDTKLIEKMQARSAIMRINDEILNLRQRYYETTPVMDYTERKAIINRLNELALDKVDQQSVMLGQGVVKDEELKRSLAKRVGATNGIELHASDVAKLPVLDKDRAANDEMVRAQSARMDTDNIEAARESGGAIYKPTYGRDKNNRVVPTGHFTGQDLVPSMNRPPAGAKSRNPNTRIFPARKPLEETTPKKAIR